MSRYADKRAFAEGYHAGMIDESFDNPYADFDLRVQFNYGYRTGCEVRMRGQLTQETLYAECTSN
jgi:hypothetical protein